MKALSRWSTWIGVGLLVIGVVVGHFLQYVIDHDLACGIAAVVGVVAGSFLLEGWSIRLKQRRRLL